MLQNLENMVTKALTVEYKHDSELDCLEREYNELSASIAMEGMSFRFEIKPHNPQQNSVSMRCKSPIKEEEQEINFVLCKGNIITAINLANMLHEMNERVTKIYMYQ